MLRNFTFSPTAFNEVSSSLCELYPIHSQGRFLCSLALIDSFIGANRGVPLRFADIYLLIRVLFPLTSYFLQDYDTVTLAFMWFRTLYRELP